MCKCVCVCVCERERERERECVCGSIVQGCVCVFAEAFIFYSLSPFLHLLHSCSLSLSLKSLSQTYIESENKRLERDPSRCFDAREINVRMEYRFCPNMIVIDTPGMLHPPKVTHCLLLSAYSFFFFLSFSFHTPIIFLEAIFHLPSVPYVILSTSSLLSHHYTPSTSPPHPHPLSYPHLLTLTLCHTPSLHVPQGRQLTPQQRALAQASREAESLVLSKIRCQDYIILCVEDTTDWKHATTR